jgi:SAM-dependent methyltransferase
MASVQGAINRVRRAIYGSPAPKINPRVANLEHVFKAPPLSGELIKAIRLISPHLELGPTEASRRFWEAEQNGCCWIEYEGLRDVLSELPKPIRVLEIGPGLGRSLVFFSKKFGWQDCDLHAYEADGTTTKYVLNGPRFEDSFCGTISEFRHVLQYNGVTNVIIHDAKSIAMSDLPRPFDLVYGFYNIGYHWSLEHFFDEVLALIGDNGIAVFTVPRDFAPFPRLQQLPFRCLDKDRVTDGDSEKLLILGPAGKGRGAF